MNAKIEHLFSAEELSPELIDILTSIDLLYFPTPWKVESWRELFQNNSRLLTLMRISGNVVGFALFDFSYADSFAHLLKIIIIPEFRKCGRGEVLLKSSLRVLLTDKKVSNYFLEVDVANHAAVGLYQRLGFQIIHTKKDFYGASKDAYIMTADLSYTI